MRRRRFALLSLFASFATWGCTEAIPLGSECPADPGVCKRPASGDGAPRPELPEDEDDDLEPLDGGAPFPARDAEPPVEAGSAVDAGEPRDGGPIPLFPAMRNPSFELTGGAAGDVTVLSLNGTVIAPWYTCQPVGGGTPGPLTAVRVEHGAVARDTVDGGALDQAVAPQHGTVFVSMQYFAGLIQLPLLQQLREPMRAGVPYGLAIDVRVSNPASNLSLILAGTADSCWSSNDLLTVTPPITQSGWRTLCLHFTPATDLPNLVLAVGSTTPLDGSRLFLDNLRSVDGCVESPQ